MERTPRHDGVVRWRAKRLHSSGKRQQLSLPIRIIRVSRANRIVSFQSAVGIPHLIRQVKRVEYSARFIGIKIGVVAVVVGAMQRFGTSQIAFDRLAADRRDDTRIGAWERVQRPQPDVLLSRAGIVGGWGSRRVVKGKFAAFIRRILLARGVNLRQVGLAGSALVARANGTEAADRERADDDADGDDDENLDQREAAALALTAALAVATRDNPTLMPRAAMPSILNLVHSSPQPQNMQPYGL